MTLMFDVSEAYDMTKAGKYSIAVDTYLEYAVGSVKGMNEPDQPGIPIKISHLSPPPISCGSSLEEALGTEKELALLTYPVGRGFSKTWLISVIIPPLSLVKPKKMRFPYSILDLTQE